MNPFTIAVVIPYFQRHPGILRRTVESVLAQEEPGLSCQVIVVDDGAPVPARQEMEPLPPRVCVIRQDNGGVSAARNQGLAQVSPATQIVAFLDSDDVWEKGHLKRIAAAMGAGADFYFGNCRRYDGIWADLQQVMDWKLCKQFDAALDLYWFDGDFFDALLKGSPARTSTVAYRFDRMPEIRFAEMLWFCEDIFFWMEIARRTRRIAFCPGVGAWCGKGVNISETAWGTLAEVRHHIGISRYFNLVRRRFSLNREQRDWTCQALRESDLNVWQSALAAGMRGLYSGPGLALAHAARRPATVPLFPWAMARVAQSKFSRGSRR